MRISKVKGHATEEDVKNGKAREIDKMGNDAADMAANEGVRLHGDERRYIGDCYAYRQRHYEYFIRDIHNHIIEVVLIKQKILQEKQETSAQFGLRTENRQKKPLPQVQHERVVLEGEQREGFRRLKPMIAGEHLQHGKCTFTRLEQVQQFLARISFKPVEGETRGWTYLELYCR